MTCTLFAALVLLANPGTHRSMRWVGVDDEFLVRHLGGASTSPA